MKLSIVATLYLSAPNFSEFVCRCKGAAESLVGDDFELILVNDGSPDNSLELAVNEAELDHHVVVVDLSRNFGHHKAMMTGLMHATGEQVFLIDSDLEESPEWLLEFAELQSRRNCDVVYGVQAQRKGGVFEQFTGALFYMALRYLTGLNIPKNIITARLMSKRYVTALVSHLDREVFLAGLWHITGFDQQAHTVEKLSTSETTYTLRKKLSVLVNSVTSFSNIPLKAIFYIGALISLLAVIGIVYIVIMKVVVGQPLSGWTSLMASIWLLGGMIISFLGIIGIYLAKIFSETKERPYTVVKNIYGQRR